MSRFALTGLLFLLASFGAVAQDPPKQDQPQKIDSTIHPPIPLVFPEAKMPDEARRRQLNGSCLVSEVVSTKGVPEDVRLVRCSDPIFEKSSLEGAKKYRFKPAYRKSDGTPVPVTITVEINFRFRGSPGPTGP